jgi:hypothetical protein
MNKKIFMLLICLFASFSLLSVSFSQWNGVNIYEASGAKGWWVGPFFNSMREYLGDKLSAVITLVVSFGPLYVAYNYWRGQLK